MSSLEGESIPVEWLLVSTRDAKRGHLVGTNVKLVGS